MQQEILMNFVKDIEEVTSRFLNFETEGNILKITHNTLYKNMYLLKISEIETIRKIDDCFLIVTEQKSFLYIDTLSCKITTGL